MSKSIFNNNKYYESNPFTKNKEHKNRRKDTRHKKTYKTKLKDDALYNKFIKHSEYTYVDEASNMMITKENKKYYLIYNDGLLDGETCIEFNRYLDLRDYINKFYDYNKMLEDYKDNLKNTLTIQIGDEEIQLRTEDFAVFRYDTSVPSVVMSPRTPTSFNNIQVTSSLPSFTVEVDEQIRGQISNYSYSNDI